MMQLWGACHQILYSIISPLSRRHTSLPKLHYTCYTTSAPTEILPRVVHEDIEYENRWLRLKTIHFLDQKGINRKWTGIERTTTYPIHEPNGIHKEDKCDAVVVVPFFKPSNKDDGLQMILIREFRPPVGRWVIELPAGLIDQGEDYVAAAIRELREETGYKASKVLHVGPPMVNDQGITNGNCRLILLEVQEADQLIDGCKQELEDDEMIQVIFAPVEGLIPWLEKQQTSEIDGIQGDAIDARLYSYALGLQTLPQSLLK